jgi:hypothetical protein
MPKIAASAHALMKHHPTSMIVRDLIDLQGIGGEIALYISSKTVIYSVIKNIFPCVQNSRVITVGRLDRATASEAKWSVVACQPQLSRSFSNQPQKF